MKDQECSLQLWQYKLAQMILTKPSKTSKKATMKSYLSALRACSLAKTAWRDILQSPDVYKEQLVGVVVDEAHCVKKW